LGIKIGKTTVNEYLSYIESSYFLTQLYLYSPSIINQLQYPRKPYLIDTGFFTSLSTKFSKNFSRLFENFVFWQLKLNQENIFYYQDRNKNEVDFVTFEEEKVKALYQVCYDLSDFETKEREIKSLDKAIKKLNCKNAYFVVKNIDQNLLKDKNYQILFPYDFF
jgi:predicted AAA+ superfamily ATPase